MGHAVSGHLANKIEGVTRASSAEELISKKAQLARQLAAVGRVVGRISRNIALAKNSSTYHVAQIRNALRLAADVRRTSAPGAA